MEHGRIVYIRTDANRTIASGHLMRCLTIARAVEKKGGRVHFLLADRESEGEFLLRFENSQEIFDYTVLNTDYTNPESEKEKWTKLLDNKEEKVLLVDSYFVTPEYLCFLSKQVTTGYLDDLQKFDYPVDWIINYDLRVNKGFYKSAKKIYTGGMYAPLREQFGNGSYQVRERVKNILLSTGGTDQAGFLVSFLEYVLQQENSFNLDFHILLGSMNIHRQKLEALEKEHENIIIHENVEEVAPLMESMDLAVTAGGGTLYELCAVGVPSISIGLSPSQSICLQDFDALSVVPYMGEANEEGISSRVYAKLMELRDSLVVRNELSVNAGTITDGRGAERIAQILLSPTG